jgi:hypothetical protein
VTRVPAPAVAPPRGEDRGVLFLVDDSTSTLTAINLMEARFYHRHGLKHHQTLVTLIRPVSCGSPVESVRTREGEKCHRYSLIGTPSGAVSAFITMLGEGRIGLDVPLRRRSRASAPGR